MGIPGFGRWLSSTIKNSQVSTRGLTWEFLGIDGNGLLHNAKSDVLAAVRTQTEEEIWEMIFRTLMEKIVDLYDTFQPKIIHFAIDGVAPAAKLSQQRTRRERSVLEPSPNFNGAQISPGTKFMDFLDARIRSFLDLSSMNKIFGDCLVIYSSHLIQGEGEHKIMAYLRETEISGNKMIYGLDGDLIILAMLVPGKDFYISRESKDKIISVNNVKRYLDKENITYLDFAAVMYFMGNDFIHHFPALRDIMKANVLLNTLKSTHLRLTTPSGELHLQNLKIFVSKLARMEPDLLMWEYRNGQKRPDWKFDEIKSHDKEGFHREYSTYYYNEVFQPVNDELDDLCEVEDMIAHIGQAIHKSCEETINGLAWYLEYYQRGMSGVNQDWTYPFHYNPMIASLKKFFEDNPRYRPRYKPERNMVTFNSKQQLLAIIPIKAKDAVPEAVEKYYNRGSPIRDMFFSDFVVDSQGTSQSHATTVRIPLPDRHRLWRLTRDDPEIQLPDLAREHRYSARSSPLSLSD